MKRPPQRNRLPREFYHRRTKNVARDLLGKALLRRINGTWVGGTILETEAYLPQGDPASHSVRGQTRSNASMFAKPGTLYDYPIHAKHCLNAVTESEGLGAAVLIRAIEPLWGKEAIEQNRGHSEQRRLTSGPAMICQALEVNRELDGVDLVHHSDILIAALDDAPKPKIAATTRIGISKAKDKLLLFYVQK